MRGGVERGGLKRLPLLARLVMAAAALATACGDSQGLPRRALTTQAEGGGRMPDQVILNGTHTLTREGVKKAIVVARRISFFNLEGKVEADTVEVTFYDASGIQQSRLNALFGEIDQHTNDMLARGRMLIVADDGTRIEGDELRYDAARDLLVSAKPVTIFQRGNRIRGKSVESDPGLTNIRISGSSAILRTGPRERQRKGSAGSVPSVEGRRVVPKAVTAPARAPADTGAAADSAAPQTGG